MKTENGNAYTVSHGGKHSSGNCHFCGAAMRSYSKFYRTRKIRIEYFCSPSCIDQQIAKYKKSGIIV